MKRFITLLIIVFIVFGMNKVHEPKIVQRTWTVDDSKAYARDKLLAEADAQWVCLDKLWQKESNWRPEAYNKRKVMGKNAGGIPQILDMKPSTPATLQIERGLAYIYYRYGTPCNAWNHERRRGWY